MTNIKHKNRAQASNIEYAILGLVIVSIIISTVAIFMMPNMPEDVATESDINSLKERLSSLEEGQSSILDEIGAARARISVTSVNAPSEVPTGTTADVSAVVANTGGKEGTETIEFVVEGETVDSQEVTVGPGETKTVTFQITKSEAGSYDLNIGGVSATLQVASGTPSPVYVLHAGSLTKPFQRINEINDRLDVQSEPHGSVAVSRLISEGQKHPDVAGVSDYSLIPDFLISEGKTDWYAQFARNEVVLCYTEESKYANEINQSNWYKILARSDVKFGFGNPNADPGGYRAMMAIQLAELYYDNAKIFDDLIAANTAMSAPEENNGSYTLQALKLDQLNPARKVETGAMEVAVIPKLEKGSIDYMFNYRSIAVQHDFKFVKLPDEISLGKVKYADTYEKSKVELTGGTVKKGKPIVYGITILKDAKNKQAAVDFLEYLFSEEGREVFENMGQPPIYPPRTNKKSALPKELQDIVVEE